MKKVSGKIIMRVALFLIASGAIITITDTISSHVAADVNSASANVGVGVDAACTLSATYSEHTSDVTPGGYLEKIGDDSVFAVSCNDPDGYVVYAVGYTNDVEGNTELISANGDNIITGTATQGYTSNWAFKIHDPTDGLIIQPGYDNYSLIPRRRAAIVKRESGYNATGEDTFQVSYSIYVKHSQPGGIYSGKVLYVLYAPSSHWPQPDPKDYGNMQDFSCSQLANVGDTGLVTDSRDGNKYYIRKLVDGKCWMIENLRLGDSKLANRTLTPDNTDLHDIDSYELPPSSTDGFNDETVANIYVVEKTVGDEKIEYGGYYNWLAATAGSGANIRHDRENATSSICPKGWRLPSGESPNDFSTLNSLLGVPPETEDRDDNWTDPYGPYFLHGGYYERYSYSSDLVHNRGTEGDYWTSTSAYYSSNGEYGVEWFSLSSTSASPVTGSGSSFRKYGYSVRCLTE